MNAERTDHSLCIAVLLLAAVCPAIHAQSAGLAGVVRDARGDPLSGAQVTVLCAKGEPAQAITHSDGAFRFASLTPGACGLSAKLAGYAQSDTVSVTITREVAKADLTLRPLDPVAVDASAAAKPQFQSAGIRGLIDPGGYSASANAAAAAGLISGIADMRRTADSPSSEVDAPTCTLGPALAQAVSANPQSADANRRLAEFDFAHGEARLAIPLLERARQANPANPRIAGDLAEALLATEQFEAARRLLIDFPPAQRNASYHQRLARADEGLGQFTAASEEYRLAAREQPGIENTFGIGYELVLAGRPSEASKVFQQGLNAYPAAIQLLLGEGTTEFLDGHISNALTTFLKSVDLDPLDPRPYPFVVEAFAISGEQKDRVLSVLSHYLDLAANDGEGYFLYARALGYQQQGADPALPARIESLLRKAIDRAPALAQAHLQLAILYARRDDYTDAVPQFEITLRLAPDLQEVHYRLASAYRRTGQPDAAAREMKLFLESKAPRPADGASSPTDLRRFLSVVSATGDAGRHQSAACPAPATP